VSLIGIGILALEVVLLVLYKFHELYFYIALPIMGIVLAWNMKSRIHITIAFVSAVFWMVGVILYRPEPNGINRLWEFDDFLPLIICALNFIIGAWLYIYNRVRW